MGTIGFPDDRSGDADGRDQAADARDEAADQREQRDDARERVLDRWERELAARAAQLHLLDEGEEEARGLARLQRAENHARRRLEAEARRDGAIERDIDRSRGTKLDASPSQPMESGESAEAVALARLAELLQSKVSLGEILDAILTAVVDTLPESAAASVALWTEDGLQPAASSTARALELDAIQLEAGYGPLVDAAEGQTEVVTTDLASDGRWPALATRVAASGRQAALSIGLSLGGEATGALTLYARPDVPFGDQSIGVAGLLAAHVSVALGWTLERLTHEAQVQAWERGLASRDIIGQAKGILMEQRSLDADHAFYVLRNVSQRMNLKLRDVAEHVVRQRRLPDALDPPDPRGPA